jgi:hypothetical protein
MGGPRVAAQQVLWIVGCLERLTSCSFAGCSGTQEARLLPLIFDDLAEVHRVSGVVTGTGEARRNWVGRQPR